MYLTQVHAYAVQRRDKILPANLMQGITAPPADGSFVPVQGNSSFHATSAESHPMTQPMRPPRQACHPDFAFSDHFPINFLIFFRSFFRSFFDSDQLPQSQTCVCVWLWIYISYFSALVVASIIVLSALA